MASQNDGQNDGSSDGPASKNRTAGDDDLKQRLDGLSGKLAEQEQLSASKYSAEPAEKKSDWGKAVKLSSEFIAGVIVGAGLGYFIDRLAGTAPWGMIIFLFLGFGAGVLNVLRSAGAIAKPDARLNRDRNREP